MQLSTLDSGVSVVSVETPNSRPLATLGVVVRTGSRFETYDSQGVSHALRICAGTGTKRFSQLNVVRSMQQAGGPLQAVQGREHMLYAAQVHKDKVDDGEDHDSVCSLGSSTSILRWSLGIAGVAFPNDGSAFQASLSIVQS